MLSIVNLPIIFKLDGIFAIPKLDVSALLLVREIVESNASSDAPPASDLGEWLRKPMVHVLLVLDVIGVCGH